MALRTQFNLILKSSLDASDPYSGVATAQVLLDQLLADGDGDNQASYLHQSSRSVSASSNEDVDFTALTDAFGNALSSLNDIALLVIEADSANGDVLQVKQSASNGWSAFLADVSDIIEIRPGSSLVLYSPIDSNYAVSASDKSINVANADSGAAATYTLTLVGRSS
jgi:hypothetical protein